MQVQVLSCAFEFFGNLLWFSGIVGGSIRTHSMTGPLVLSSTLPMFFWQRAFFMLTFFEWDGHPWSIAGLFSPVR